MEWRGFTGGSYTSQSRLADAEMLINWYPEQIESPAGTVRQALYPSPGFRTFVDLPVVTGTRCLFSMNGRTVAVVGNTVFSLAAGPVSTTIGTVVRDSNQAQVVMHPTNGQAIVSSGTNGYLLNFNTNAFTQVLTAKSIQIGMLDGWFMSLDATGTLWVSNHDDGSTWDPTQFIRRQTSPDTWKAMIVVPPDIWLIGSLSGDVWYDAGSFPFPFAPRQGLNFKYGIAAPFSLAAVGSTVLWLAQATEGTGIVVRTQGYQPQRISTYAVETAIASYARMGSLSNAESFVYEAEGHTFYCLRFPTPEQTWAYDINMNTWHQRGYWNPTRNQFEVWKPRVHCYAFDKHLVGDDATGTIQEMDVAFGTELDGSAIRRLRRSPAAFSELRNIPMRVVEFFLENGLGLQTGQGSNPLVMFRTSDDGGRTWGNERQATAGRVGQYRTAIQFWRLGVARDRVVELSASDPIPWRVMAAFINHDGAQAQQ